MHSFHKFPLSWLVSILCLIPKIEQSSTNGRKVFFDNGTSKFNHLIVDEIRESVYIGAVNRLYRLSLNLELKENISTGPVGVGKYADNYNKILILDNSNSQLISCGSHCTNSCDIYKLENPLRKIKTVTSPVVANGPSASTVAFIGPSFKTQNSSIALYVGATYANDSVQQCGIPAVATRSLKGNSLLQILHSDSSSRFGNTQISLNQNWQKKYIVNYVYGFSFKSHSYFLTTQMNSTEPSPYISKLIRVCQQDTHYQSYTEIPIKCTDVFGKNYNLAQAAFVATPSSELAESLSITTFDEVLFVIFAQSKELTDKPLHNESALCIYSLKSIRDKFAENIQKCYDERGKTGLKYIFGPSSIRCFKSTFTNSDFCGTGNTLNFPFGGNIPVQTNTTITFDTLLTAITAHSKLNLTILHTGTHTGHLKQIVVKNIITAWEYNDVVIDEGSPVNPDLQLDPTKHHLYAMTEQKLTKIKISNLFLSISHFSPNQGPWEGGTKVTISTKSLDNSSSFENDHIGIKIAGVPCTEHKDHQRSSNEIVCITNESNSSNREGPVEIVVNGISISFEKTFSFVNPKIFNFSPRQGPTFGGTKLMISGQYLNAGNSIEVFIGNISCPIFFHKADVIKCTTNRINMTLEGDVTVKIDKSTLISSDRFNYKKDSDHDENGYNLVPKGIPAGDIKILLPKKYQQSAKNFTFLVYNENQSYNNSCEINLESVICFSPIISNPEIEFGEAGKPKEFHYSLLTHDGEKTEGNFYLHPNPIFKYYEVHQNLRFIIKGQNIDNACQKADFNVNVQNESCEVVSVTFDELICDLTTSQICSFGNESDYKYNASADFGNITIKIGRNFLQIVHKRNLTDGFLVIQSEKRVVFPMYFLCIGIFGLMISTCLIIRCRMIYRKKYSKRMLERINRLELCVAAECKEAFAELQTETDLTSESFVDGLPFLNYDIYVMKNLFPNMKNRALFLNESTAQAINNDGIKLLQSLIRNKTFLLVFIQTLEKNKNFTMNNRVYVASVLMITLQNNMDYCTDILETLLADLIKKYAKGKNHPKLLLRRTESVVEKMLSIWFTFLLHRFLRECAGEPLFKLFIAVKQRINKGPVDMITSEARYSLNQEKLIRQQVNYHPITVHINVSSETAAIIGLKSAIQMAPVEVLDCDTITQVKEKALDEIFRNLRYSKIPKVSELELKWMTESEGKILCDDDNSSKIEGEWKQKNTLLHYNVPDGAIMDLLSFKQLRRTSTSSVINLLSAQCVEQQISGSASTLIQGDETHFKEWHLIKPDNSDNFSDPNTAHKMVSEVYLSRILANKVTLQKFVDNLFQAIMKKTYQNHCFPIAIKYMFDFLDEQAAQHGITDWEVVHTWKNNCLPLRFWVNLIKNPNFLFDIHKSNIVDSCLSVIAQAFMDSYSTSHHHLGKDSSTTKLLYAKDVPSYKEWVKQYYSDIRDMPAIPKKKAKMMFAKQLLPHANDFNTDASIHELYEFMKLYKNELLTELREIQTSQNNLLANQFEKAMKLLEVD